jgi:hypothetical protein
VSGYKRKNELAQQLAQNVKGCTIVDVQYSPVNGWSIIVERRGELFHEVWEVYPMSTWDGPNCEVTLHAENLAA